MTGTAYSDHFSPQAAAYAAHRPGYPEALFDLLAQQSPGRLRAWDCGCGNGQVARGLAGRFREVIASDPSAAQLERRDPATATGFVRCLAAPAPLATASCDLVAVGQALHWFPLDAFYREVQRILRPGGLFAVWCYSLLRVTPAVDLLLDRFYRDTLGAWWPPERVHVDHGYRDLPFPFAELHAPRMELELEWDLDQLGGYLSTWSACRRCREATGLDPLPGLLARLAAPWGDPGTKRRVRWPLHLRLGRS